MSEKEKGMDWKDELMPAVESDSKGFFVEEGGEGDVHLDGDLDKAIDELHGPGAAAALDEAIADGSVFGEKPVALRTSIEGRHPSGEGRLHKRSVLMNLHPEQQSENYMYFEHMGDGERTDGYYMTRAHWDDFGQPETITVVVYPRDMFNS